MPRAKKRQRKAEYEHTYLVLRVERYEAFVGTGVNHHVYGPQYDWGGHDDDPLYEVKTQLTIAGTATYPDERAGVAYELTIYGNDAPSQHLHLTLKDAQARDEHGARKYRSYRGRQIPVYSPPDGLGTLEKVRGEPCWTGWAFVAPQFVQEALALLGHRKDLFLAIDERKENRARWIRSMTLQTADPDEE